MPLKAVLAANTLVIDTRLGLSGMQSNTNIIKLSKHFIAFLIKKF